MNATFRKLSEQIRHKQDATDAANRRVVIPDGWHVLLPGESLKMGDKYWRHSFGQFIPFDAGQIEIAGTVLACEIVIRNDKREECRVTIPIFSGGDFILFMAKRSIGVVFEDTSTDAQRIAATVSVSAERMRDLLRESDASFEFVTEFVSEFGAKEDDK